MAKYRKRPIVIEAVQWFSNGQLPVWAQGQGEEIGDHVRIETLEGVMRADPGDWIVRGVNGEIYPVKPDIFEKTYERVEE